MERGESEQEQQEDQNAQHNIPEEHEDEIRGENPLQEGHRPQGVNAPVSGPSLGRINWRMENLETEMKRDPILTSHVKRKHTKQSTQASVTSAQNISQIPGTSRLSASATSAGGKNISTTFQCQRETVSPTDSPLYKRHKIHSDETLTSKPAIEISSDSASSPEEQKSPSPEPGTSAEAHFHEETKEVVKTKERKGKDRKTKESKDLSIEKQQLGTPMIKPALPIQKASSSGSSRETNDTSYKGKSSAPEKLHQPALSTQKASSSGSSRETSGTSYKGKSSVPEKLTCRLPINESTRAALTLCILGNRNVKEDEESSDILGPVISNNPPMENLECHKIVQSSIPFDIPVIKGTDKSVDSRLMPPPDMRIESFTPPNKTRNEFLKESKRESKTWWCIDSVTFYPLDQLHHRFRSSHLDNHNNWNITSYPRNIPSSQPSSLQFPSRSHNPRIEPPEVEPAEEDEEFVGRPSIHGTSKRILGLVPHIGNITLTSVLWTEPNPFEVFCRGIKRCKFCGMPQGLFTRLPITIKLLWYNSLDETQMPYTDTIECAFPVDIWGTASLLKRQDSNVGWILDSKVLDVDLMLLKYAEAQDYGSDISESKSAEGRSSKRKTSESESESSEGERSEGYIV
ncbi:uncharacterized protein [Euwallacea similis]|uniref:uncharacterized protein n=1 Tax=Euwallacea similis TaxID=1736056 RepID=UPI00344D4B08